MFDWAGIRHGTGGAVPAEGDGDLNFPISVSCGLVRARRDLEGSPQILRQDWNGTASTPEDTGTGRPLRVLPGVASALKRECSPCRHLASHASLLSHVLNGQWKLSQALHTCFTHPSPSCYFWRPEWREMMGNADVAAIILGLT